MRRIIEHNTVTVLNAAKLLKLLKRIQYNTLHEVQSEYLLLIESEADSMYIKMHVKNLSI